MDSRGTTFVFSWNAGAVDRRTAGFKQLQKDIDSEFLRLVAPYVPHLTGALEQSAPINTVVGSGTIIHSTPYARRRYYLHPKGSDVRNGLRGSYWGERCVDDNRTALYAFISARAKERLK